MEGYTKSYIGDIQIETGIGSIPAAYHFPRLDATGRGVGCPSYAYGEKYAYVVHHKDLQTWVNAQLDFVGDGI